MAAEAFPTRKPLWVLSAPPGAVSLRLALGLEEGEEVAKVFAGQSVGEPFGHE